MKSVSHQNKSLRTIPLESREQQPHTTRLTRTKHSLFQTEAIPETKTTSSGLLESYGLTKYYKEMLLIMQ